MRFKPSTDYGASFLEDGWLEKYYLVGQDLYRVNNSEKKAYLMASSGVLDPVKGGAPKNYDAVASLISQGTGVFELKKADYISRLESATKATYSTSALNRALAGSAWNDGSDTYVVDNRLHITVRGRTYTPSDSNYAALAAGLNKAYLDGNLSKTTAPVSSTSTTPSVSLAVSTATGVPAGSYKDSAGYGYKVTSTSVDIYSKTGSKLKTVKSGTKAWDPLLTNMLNDYRAGKLTLSTEVEKKPASKSGGKSGGASGGKSGGKSRAYTPPATTQTPPAAATSTKVEAGITEQAWFWPAVIGGTVVAGGALWYFFLRSPSQPAARPATA